jgi:lipoprotein-releasing system permease protein
MIGMTKGKIEMFLRVTAETGTGHMRVVPDGWLKSHDSRLRLSDWQKDLAMLRRSPQVLAATPRARAQALLAMGTNVAAVEITGVDPVTEPATYRFVRHMTAGRYLMPQDKDSIVLGQATADTLKIELGDQVVTTAVGADGSMKSAMFTLIGIVDTGNQDMDAAICQVNLSDLDQLGQRPGAGEITMLLKNPSAAIRSQAELSPGISRPNRLLRWDEVSPQSKLAIVLNQLMSRWITVILMIVAVLGLASAQLTAILERQKELAMLAAIGMSSRRLLKLILLEATGIGVLGAGTALVTGAPLLYYLATVGVKVSGNGKGLQAMGMLIDPVIRSGFGWWVCTYAVVLSMTSAFIAALYPAWFAVKLDPISALRVSQ